MSKGTDGAKAPTADAPDGTPRPRWPLPELFAEGCSIYYHDPDRPDTDGHGNQIDDRAHIAGLSFPEHAEQIVEAVNGYAAAIARIRELEAEREWRPISSAPKDGTEILGFRADAGVLLIRWTSLAEFLTDTELEEVSEDAAHKEDWFYADFIHGGRLEYDGLPTHWMPLPKAPPTERVAQRAAAVCGGVAPDTGAHREDV